MRSENSSKNFLQVSNNFKERGVLWPKTRGGSKMQP